MCDTMVIPPAAAFGRTTLFAKNSDRQRNEAQAVQYVTAKRHERGADLHCTYISIPEARSTYGVLLCRPFWTWGAEMGVNERGVAVGNEGVISGFAPAEIPALTGLDLVRLALERGGTAREAVDTIVGLLEQHGQGGDCGHLVPAYYDNSFIVADPSEAFLIETVGRDWIVEPIQTPRAISNDYSASLTKAETSEGLGKLLSAGPKEASDIILSEALQAPSREHLGQACARRSRAEQLMTQSVTRDVPLMKQILRDHGVGSGANWSPAEASEASLCMHAGLRTDGSHRDGQTVNSMIAALRTHGGMAWVTGTAAPCLSVFRPVLVGEPLSRREEALSDRFDRRLRWWRHEQSHRNIVQGDFAGFLSRFAAERDAFEAELRERVASIDEIERREDRMALIHACWDEADTFERIWHAHAAKLPRRDSGASFLREWSRMSRIARMSADVGDWNGN